MIKDKQSKEKTGIEIKRDILENPRKAVFLGITVSIFTPNRIGEFGGRIFCLKSADRIKGVIITILGNVAQLLVTIIFGSIAFLFYIKRFDSFFIFHEKYYLFLASIYQH